VYNRLKSAEFNHTPTSAASAAGDVFSLAAAADADGAGSGRDRRAREERVGGPGGKTGPATTADSAGGQGQARECRTFVPGGPIFKTSSDDIGKKLTQENDRTYEDLKQRPRNAEIAFEN